MCGGCTDCVCESRPRRLNGQATDGSWRNGEVERRGRMDEEDTEDTEDTRRIDEEDGRGRWTRKDRHHGRWRESERGSERGKESKQELPRSRRRKGKKKGRHGELRLSSCQGQASQGQPGTSKQRSAAVALGRLRFLLPLSSSSCACSTIEAPSWQRCARIMWPIVAKESPTLAHCLFFCFCFFPTCLTRSRNGEERRGHHP